MDDLKGKRLKQLLMKNKELGVVLEKERTLRLKNDSKVREYERICSLEEDRQLAAP
jgi:hypothetical protein